MSFDNFDGDGNEIKSWKPYLSNSGNVITILKNDNNYNKNKGMYYLLIHSSLDKMYNQLIEHIKCINNDNPTMTLKEFLGKLNVN